jgi:hypothetical protein
MATFFQKPKFSLSFWGNVFEKQQVSKGFKYQQILQISTIIHQVWKMHTSWLAHNNSSFLFN